MRYVFWLVAGELCGRPGPNQQPWNLQEMRDAGIGGILSVNRADSVCEDELAAADIKYACIPLAASAPAIAGDLELCLERLPRAFEFARAHVERGSSVLVHCRHGKDRTGLFMAYYLLRRDELSVEEAIGKVKAVRPIAMTAQGWDEFVPKVLVASLRQLEAPGVGVD